MNQINACLGIIEHNIGDCKYVDNVIDSRLPREMRLTVFEKEVFPGEYASLTVNVATNQPVALDFLRVC